MTNHLPTGSFSTWKVAEFRASLNSTLKEDRKKGDAQLRLYFYAVTKRGWDEIRTSTLSWMSFDRRRKVFAYAKRELTMTLFSNRTVRLVINELEYRDRPCVVLFHRTGSDRYLFEIIPESIFPTRYRSLLALCDRQTHPKSRRWGIVKNAP